MRRDASRVVTGSDGKGNEKIVNFAPGSKTSGGIGINKWDENKMSPPFTTAQRQSGINWPIMRMADVMLMLAEVKAELGTDNSGAISLVNQIRARAFGNTTHNISSTLSGDNLKEAIWQERKFELLGEGMRRWDLIRSGKYSERAVAIRTEMTNMIASLKAKGYYTFANGNTIPTYIFTKLSTLSDPLTYECTDKTSPTLYPGWRGQYKYSGITGKCTTHISYKGLLCSLCSK